MTVSDVVGAAMRSAFVVLGLLVAANVYAIVMGVGSVGAPIAGIAGGWVLVWIVNRVSGGGTSLRAAAPTPLLGALLLGVGAILLEYGVVMSSAGAMALALYGLVLFVCGAAWASWSSSGPAVAVWVAIAVDALLLTYWYLRFIGSEGAHEWFGGEIYWIAQEQVSSLASWLPVHCALAWTGWQAVSLLRHRVANGRQTSG
jgi:hypothetical protein